MSYRRPMAMVGAALLVACSQEGTQTGGEGDQDPCAGGKPAEVDEATARELGFAVDDELPLFGRTFEDHFHEGNVDCSALPPSSDGVIQVRATLTGIFNERIEPTFPDFPEDCPRAGEDRLFYRAEVELQTDDGTLSAVIPATAYSRKLADAEGGHRGLTFDAIVMPSLFSGSLGIHVDPGRSPEEEWASVVVVLGGTEPSVVVFDVLYGDGRDPAAEHGEGIFWPYDTTERAYCGWLDPYSEVPQSEAISIDEYNALKGR